MASLAVTEYTDPACPWAYSASPALAVLRWRYRHQLRWRIAAIGLTENPQRYVDAGYTPARMSAGMLRFRRYGMPFAPVPRPRIAATSRACRAIVATRLLDPPRERDVLRALQFAWFTTPLQLDEDGDIARALSVLAGLDVESVVAAIDDRSTLEAYEQDKRDARTAEGGATHYQGKARQTDGPVRYSAPSLVFESEAGLRLEAGGFQPVEAYDVLIANLDRGLERHPPPQTPLEALAEFPSGLVTAEVAAILAPNNVPPDRDAAERALAELLGEGTVRRTPLGDDALWQPA
jgi:protein-disulfide isomerase-like protein with CxxC motif